MELSETYINHGGVLCFDYSMKYLIPCHLIIEAVGVSQVMKDGVLSWEMIYSPHDKRRHIRNFKKP